MRSKYSFVLTLLVLVACAAAAHAVGKRTALIPARVFKGPAANGPALTQALRAELQAHGYDLVPENTVSTALKSRKIDLAKPQSEEQLAGLADALGVDYVVYPRVLGVGAELGSAPPQTPQATVHVNVLDHAKRKVVFTMQVGQTFPLPSASNREVVMPAAQAKEAAGKLLKGFFDKGSQ